MNPTSVRARVRGVLFDVDFTLIRPGPTFQARGYQAFCERHGLRVDPSAFDLATAGAASLLDTPEDAPYDAELYVAYTRRIIEGMGATGPAVDPCAREIYDEWAACRHFELYDDVRSVLRALAADGVSVGLVSNSHRSLDSFASHFDLQGLIDASVSSSEHGLMKPHPSIFNAALEAMGVRARDAWMVGDSVRHDVDGALKAGLRAALLHRSDTPHPQAGELARRAVPVLRSLTELPALIAS